MKHLFFLFAAFLFSVAGAQTDYTRYVNPFIGTTNYGTCNPGAATPGGLMTCTPFNVMGSDKNPYDKEKYWCSTPYEYNNVFMTGFAHVNLSGVGCPELSGLLTFPSTGDLHFTPAEYGSAYQDEQAHPGYYAAFLKKYGVKAEVTVTPRTSRERYVFPKGESHVLLNLGDGLTNESGATVRKVSATEFEGVKTMGTFCYCSQAVFPLYFALRVNKVPASSGYWKKRPTLSPLKAEWDPDKGEFKQYTAYEGELSGDEIGVFLNYQTEEGEAVEVSVGVSLVSCENAWENLNAEQGSRSFDQLRQAAHDAWQEQLSRIEVEGGTDDQKTIFYTALYHVLLQPNILQDVNGDFPAAGAQRKILNLKNEGSGMKNRYTVLSLWDTYRNASQLLSLVFPDKQRDVLRSMTAFAKETGWMPKWELYGRETFTMDGDPAAPYIADATVKGILPKAEAEEAYFYLKKSALAPSKENPLRIWNDAYMEKGFVPMYGGFDISVSECLEYCVADHALAQMAEYLGHDDDAKLFRQRSLNYRKYYDKETGALRPLLGDGSFLKDFNPRQGENFSPPAGFHEGSAWNYTFYAPHDVQGLAKLMGGRDKFVQKLEWIFKEGLFDPANEPDINYPFLFAQMKGHETKTDQWARWALEKYFKNAPGGIPGNDDTGTMSAWAIFTMMGFYPDCAATPMYTLVAPTFRKVTIHLDPAIYGKDKIVIEGNGSPTLPKSVKRRISHQELLSKDVWKLF